MVESSIRRSHNLPDIPAWFPHIVESDGVAWLKAHGGASDRTLFLCWPRDEFGDEVLGAYTGDTVVWVGEYAGGCTFSLCNSEEADQCSVHAHEWKPVRRVPLPNWTGIHDQMVVYKRIVTD